MLRTHEGVVRLEPDGRCPEQYDLKRVLRKLVHSLERGKRYDLGALFRLRILQLREQQRVVMHTHEEEGWRQPQQSERMICSANCVLGKTSVVAFVDVHVSKRPKLQRRLEPLRAC